MGSRVPGYLHWYPYGCCVCSRYVLKSTRHPTPWTVVLIVCRNLIVPETYAPALLRQRAARLSKITGKYYRAPMDAEKELDIGRVFLTQLSLPWLLLFQEPIVMIISIYMAIVYVSLRKLQKAHVTLLMSSPNVQGTLYMLFAAFPIVSPLSKIVS